MILPLTGECQERKQQLQTNAAAAGFTKQQLLDAAVAALAPERQATPGSEIEEQRLMVRQDMTSSRTACIYRLSRFG